MPSLGRMDIVPVSIVTSMNKDTQHLEIEGLLVNLVAEKSNRKFSLGMIDGQDRNIKFPPLFFAGDSIKVRRTV